MDILVPSEFSNFRSDYHEKHDEKASSIDLLSDPNFSQTWIPQFIRNPHNWRVYSGRFETQTPNIFKYLSDPSVKDGENVTVIGSKRWKNYAFRAKFMFLTPTLRPPEGGVIFYFLFNSTRNYYSLHFALFKDKIEFIKRRKGVWTTIEEHYYSLRTEKEYFIEIRSRHGIHHCEVGGKTIMEAYDTNISTGSVGIGVKYCDAQFTHLSISFL